MLVSLPVSLEEAFDAFERCPDAQLLAGGTDFMVEVDFALRRPPSVVCLRRLEELKGWRLEGSEVVLGAGLTYTELMAPRLSDLVPGLVQASRTVGSPQIRNAGTLGGNLGTASPAGDSLPVLAALDAKIVVASKQGRRSLELDDLIVGPKRTTLGPGEVIVEIRVPAALGLAGVPEGRHAERNGDRGRKRRARRRLGGAFGPVRSRLGRARGDPAARCRRAHLLQDRLDRTNTPRRWRPRGVHCFGALSGVAHRRPPLHSGLPSARCGSVRGAGPRTCVRQPQRRDIGAHTVGELIDYQLCVNGREHDVADSWLGESLLYVLRERLGLPGSKNACEQGECGSCSVLMDGKLVCSCMVLAVSVARR